MLVSAVQRPAQVEASHTSLLSPRRPPHRPLVLTEPPRRSSSGSLLAAYTALGSHRRSPHRPLVRTEPLSVHTALWSHRASSLPSPPSSHHRAGAALPLLQGGFPGAISFTRGRVFIQSPRSPLCPKTHSLLLYPCSANRLSVPLV